ncbi:MmcQ/YjbR family DNA-binding protein [Actinoplanes sp. NPDC026619]|uniref:MmcQ/YjbR family DNA-binding protein n=1 Tax=Actinoplanes sp. NPDC026619 TaxID=3155798 RepID=UPI0033F42789
MSVTYGQLRDWVLALPGTREVFVEQWDHPTLRYGDKMFASGSEESTTATVKASLEDQAELIAGAPEVYQKAAYVGRFGWVRVDLARADPGELRQLVIEAWRRTAPKRVVAAYDSAQGEHDQG